MGIYLTDDDYKSIIYEPDTTASGWDGISKGDMVAVNDVIVAAFKDFDEEKDSIITMILESKQARGDKATGTGETISAGKKAYYNVTTKKVTETAGGNTLVGIFIRDAGESDLYADLAFDGNVKNLI